MAADSLVSVYEHPVVGGITKIVRLTLADQEILIGHSSTVAQPGVVAADLDIDQEPGDDPQAWATRPASREPSPASPPRRAS